MIDYWNEIEAQTFLEVTLEAEKTDMQKLLNNFTEGLDSQLNQDFFYNDKDVKKKKKKNQKIDTAVQKLEHKICWIISHIEDTKEKIFKRLVLSKTLFDF